MVARAWNYSAGSNTTLAGINTGEGMARADVNNAIRALMSEMRPVIDSVPVSPMEYGAVGSGVADDTAAINSAISTGKHVIFPRGYTFKTQGQHSITQNGQTFIIEGTVKYDGVRRALPGGAGTGFQGLFQIQDNVTGVSFIGNGTLDGNRSQVPMVIGDAGAGIYAYRAPKLTVDGPNFENFIEDGIKAFNCPEITVTRRTRFFNIGNIGVELRSYLNDPRVSPATAWSGTTYGPSGDVSGFYDLINDGLNGAGNGTGVDFSSASGAPSVNNLRISGHFRDCLLAIWSENNYSGAEANNITIDAPLIQGNFRASGGGSATTLDGIGLIGCKNSQIISPVIKNVANVAPAVGSQSVGINLVGCDGVSVINPNIVDDTGGANRMQYGIRLNGSTNIEIKGGQISGAQTQAIYKDPANASTNVRIEGVRGATDDETWGNLAKFTFTSQNVGASTTTTLLPSGGAGLDGAQLPCPGRVVALTARGAAGQVFTGNYTFKCLVDGTEQTALNLTQAGMATVSGASQGRTKRASESAAQYAADKLVAATLTTDGSWTATHDVYVDVWVDLGLKA